MKPIHFPEVNVIIGKGQPEYEELPAHVDNGDPETPVTVCLQFDTEELEKLVAQKGIFWLTTLTFNRPYHPIMVSVIKPLPDSKQITIQFPEHDPCNPE